MSFLFDDDIIIHRVMTPGLDGDGMSRPEYVALRADADAILSRPAIERLLDVPDIVGTAASGDTVVYDADADEWHPGRVVGSIAEVRGHGNVVAGTDVTLIYAHDGVTAIPFGSNRVLLELRYAGSGSAVTVARSDHEHDIRTDIRLRFSTSGSLSGGTRTLVSGTITGLNPGNTYVLTGRLNGQVRGEGSGAGRVLPRITITGATAEGAEASRTVAGVQVPFLLDHPGISITGVSSLSVSAALVYIDGDPTWVGGGDLIITIRSNR